MLTGLDEDLAAAPSGNLDRAGDGGVGQQHADPSGGTDCGGPAEQRPAREGRSPGRGARSVLSCAVTPGVAHARNLGGASAPAGGHPRLRIPRLAGVPLLTSMARRPSPGSLQGRVGTPLFRVRRASTRAARLEPGTSGSTAVPRRLDRPRHRDPGQLDRVVAVAAIRGGPAEPAPGDHHQHRLGDALGLHPTRRGPDRDGAFDGGHRPHDDQRQLGAALHQHRPGPIPRRGGPGPGGGGGEQRPRLLREAGHRRPAARPAAGPGLHVDPVGRPTRLLPDPAGGRPPVHHRPGGRPTQEHRGRPRPAAQSGLRLLRQRVQPAAPGGRRHRHPRGRPDRAASRTLAARLRSRAGRKAPTRATWSRSPSRSTWPGGRPRPRSSERPR